MPPRGRGYPPPPTEYDRERANHSTENNRGRANVPHSTENNRGRANVPHSTEYDRGRANVPPPMVYDTRRGYVPPTNNRGRRLGSEAENAPRGRASGYGESRPGNFVSAVSDFVSGVCATSSKPRPGASMVMATWNVLHQSPFERYADHPQVIHTNFSADYRWERFVKILYETTAQYRIDAFCLQEVSPTWFCDEWIMSEFLVYKHGTVAVLIRRAVIRPSDVHAVGSSLPIPRSVLLQPFDPRRCTGDCNVSKGTVRVRFYHTGLAGTVTVASTHVPFQPAENALSGAFWGGVDVVGWPHYVVAGDFNMNAAAVDGRAQLADLLRAGPVRGLGPANTFESSPPSLFTSRDVRDGSKGILDHVVGSGAVDVVAIVPGAVEDLIPHSVGDTLVWNALGGWPSDHAMVVAKVFF